MAAISIPGAASALENVNAWPSIGWASRSNARSCVESKPTTSAVVVTSPLLTAIDTAFSTTCEEVKAEVSDTRKPDPIPVPPHDTVSTRTMPLLVSAYTSANVLVGASGDAPSLHRAPTSAPTKSAAANPTEMNTSPTLPRGWRVTRRPHTEQYSQEDSTTEPHVGHDDIAGLLPAAR